MNVKIFLSDINTVESLPSRMNHMKNRITGLKVKIEELDNSIKMIFFKLLNTQNV